MDWNDSSLFGSSLIRTMETNLVHHSSLWGGGDGGSAESHHHYSHPQTHISISPQHSSNSGHAQAQHGQGGHGLLITTASHHNTHGSLSHSHAPHGIHSLDHGYNIYSAGKGELISNSKFNFENV